MYEEMIFGIKQKQEDIKNEVTSFQSDINQFKVDLIEGIVAFVKEARSEGLTGVNYKELIDLKEGVREFGFQLNNEEFVLVMREDVFFKDPPDKTIENRINLYADGEMKNLPILEISIYRNSKVEKFYSIRSFTSVGPKLLTGVCKFLPGAGKDAARVIIEQQYGLNEIWKDRPAREDFQSLISKNGTKGFSTKVN